MPTLAVIRDNFIYNNRIAELCVIYPNLKKALKLMFLHKHLFAHGDLIFLKAFLLLKLSTNMSEQLKNKIDFLWFAYLMYYNPGVDLFD